MHSQAHLIRGKQEGTAFAFNYGIEIMHGMDVKSSVIHAGLANLFLGPIFSETLAQTAVVTIELYNTDGAQGAARGTALGAKYSTSRKEAFKGLECLKIIEPQNSLTTKYQDLNQHRSSALHRILQSKG